MLFCTSNAFHCHHFLKSRYRRFISNSILKLIKTEDRINNQEKNFHDLTYNGKELSVSESKIVISKFVEDIGSVDLEKNIDGIAKICLNNPRSKNAINAKMVIEFDEIVNQLEQWTDCKGAILYGADGNFCSGGDLKTARRINTLESVYAMATLMNDILEKFRNLPMITVAYIEGTGAIGGGAELTTACDYRLICSKSDATGIGFVHAKMGIVPAWGSTGRLVSLIGPQRALDLLLECRLLNAAEATAVGLVNGTAATLADAIEWLSHKVRHDANVIKATKRTRLCYIDSGLDRRTAMLMERKIAVHLWGSPAHKAALANYIKHNK